MLTFWKKGYDGTSIPDILSSMGLSRSSLYETFGDKQTLFLEAMARYRRFIGKSGANIFDDYIRGSASPETTAAGLLREYFRSRIYMALDKRYPGGCFITNVATSLESADDRVKNVVRAHIQNVENAFREVLEKAISSGEISREHDASALAAFLLSVASGINVLARVKKDRAMLEKIVDSAMVQLK
jgi:TetR/AcrR family transcriptional repressor of nem operon